MVHINETVLKMILDNISKLEEEQNDQGKTLSNVRVDVGTLQAKAGIWGLFGGLIPAVISLGIYFLKK